MKEKLESQMMILKLERVDIMTERDEKIKQLEKMTGQTVVRPEVPDYIAKEQITIDPEVPHNNNVTNSTGSKRARQPTRLSRGATARTTTSSTFAPTTIANATKASSASRTPKRLKPSRRRGAKS